MRTQQRFMMTASSVMTRLLPLLLLASVISVTQAVEECCSYPKDCHDIPSFGYTEDGPYEVKPAGATEPFFIYCEFDENGTAWTLLQRRVNGFTSFNRSWHEYRNGFGVPGPASNYWLGLDRMHAVTTQRQYTIRFDLKDWDGEARHADYGLFYINDLSTSYSLMLDYYLGGTLANSLLDLHHLARFGTYDNDIYSTGNTVHCGQRFGGGWWYAVERCWDANLNGLYQSQGSGGGWNGITWNYWKTQYSFKESAMRIKPTL